MLLNILQCSGHPALKNGPAPRVSHALGGARTSGGEGG